VLSKHDNASALPDDFNQGDGAKSTTATYANTLVAMYNENCPTEFFDKDSDFTNTIICGEQTLTYTFDFLTPVVNGEDASYSEDNDYSPIMLFEYAEVEILFTGDAGEATIEEYLTAYPDGLDVDIYKVSHHGSKNNVSTEFIASFDPEYAIIQCGTDNSHSHPDVECLQILYDYDNNLKLYRNDTNGNVNLIIKTNGIFEFALENSDCTDNWIDGVGESIVA